jgi:hypothetical protein
MNSSTYTHPVDQLLSHGDPRHQREWPNYLDLALSSQHIPELIRMLTDEELIYADSDSLEVWAPLHAWRALGQLRAIEAIDPLLEQLHSLDDDHDDWIGEEYPDVFAMIGPAAIPTLTKHLAADTYGLWARVCLGHALANIGNAFPEARKPCVENLTQLLSKWAYNDPTLNAFLINYLTKLKAVESLETIRKAYQDDCVDLSVLGDVEEAEIYLGVRQRRSTPKPRLGWMLDRHEGTQESACTMTPRKIGRNEPCPCGSGKKYKRCCLNKP